ncbi:unnamed protein product [Heligmosomoides polygyrus]|uniref:CB1 cannabinoid receptor-interacting protein 1 n=1 Tax=Heligmosomoides polygyrus TaxID=6339 RepID=A0A183F3V8_HELPZ|nr:unnamed protein product [Heligmosomoides polygyrus]
MIRQCFQTLCKEWMSECHWFCDSVKEQELKQRLSRTSISSDMDIDRIVKESKTTTITEARETIYFRHRGESEGVDDLMSDYHSLEMELKDINEKNKELRKKFFDDKV